MVSLHGTHDSVRRDGGFILVTVLWLLAALAGLATIYGVFIINSVVPLALNDDTLRAEAATSAAVELFVHAMTASDDARPIQRPFTVRVGAAVATVTWRPETARVDLNVASKELLAGLMRALGGNPSDVAAYADRIVAWRRPALGGGVDEEAALYQTAGLAYSPRRGPFQHVDELALVFGIPDALKEKMMAHVTVYSGRPNVNIVEAAPTIIAALPGVTPEILHSFLAERSGGTIAGRAFQRVATSSSGLASVDFGRAFRVSILVALDDGRRASTEAVILLRDDGPEPYRVLSWREVFEGGAIDQP